MHGVLFAPGCVVFGMCFVWRWARCRRRARWGVGPCGRREDLARWGVVFEGFAHPEGALLEPVFVA